MLKIYCTDCGSPTSYSATKPKFCSNCAKSFENTVVNKVLPQKRTIAKIKKALDYDYDEDISNESDINKIPDISEIEYEISSTKYQGQSIKEIMGTRKDQNSFKEEAKSEKKQSKADKKKILEEWKREASAIRSKDGRNN